MGKNLLPFLKHEKIPIFPGKYHQNGGFSWAMLASGRAITIKMMFSTRHSCRVFLSNMLMDPKNWLEALTGCFQMTFHISREKRGFSKGDQLTTRLDIC